MDFNRAQRCLRLLEGAEDDGAVMESQELPMTQVPDGFSSEEEVFINTQIQSKLDEAKLQDDMKKSLNKFALAASPVKSPMKRPARTSAKDKSVNTKQARPSHRKRQDSSQIKSVTQYSTESSDSSKDRRRVQDLVSLLSGKKGKVKDILTRLERKNESDKRTRFCTYKQEEWKYILGLLRCQFPQCQRSEVRAVHRYMYGDESDVWYSSQYAPSQSDVESCEESEMGLLPKQAPLVFSLSQVMEDTEGRQQETTPDVISLESQKPLLGAPTLSKLENDPDDVERISDTSENMVIPSPQREAELNTRLLTETRSIISNSVDEVGSEISIDPKLALEFRKKMLTDSPELASAPAATDGTFQNEILSPVPLSSHVQPLQPNVLQRPLSLHSIGASHQTQYSRLSPNKHGGADNLIDLTHGSFKVVKSLISPLKADVQVPATRNPTLIEGALPVTLESSHTPSQDVIRIKIFKQAKRRDARNPSEPPSNHLVNREDCVDDSEEDGEYSIFDFRIPKRPRLALEQLQYPVIESAVHSDAETEINQTPTAPTPSQQSSVPPSAQQLRQKLRNIGLKPGRTRKQMLEQMEAVSQNLEADTEVEQRKEIFMQFTSLVEQMPELLEKVYTFEPIILSDLMRILVDRNPFIDNVEESVVRDWADQMGICLRNGP